MNILSIAMLAGFQKQLNPHKFLLFSLGFICTSAIHPLGIWKTYRSGFPCFAEENWALCVFIHPCMDIERYYYPKLLQMGLVWYVGGVNWMYVFLFVLVLILVMLDAYTYGF